MKLEFKEVVSASWREPMTVIPEYVLWKKFQILQSVLRSMRKPLSGIKTTLGKAIGDLVDAQKLPNFHLNCVYLKQTKIV